MCGCTDGTDSDVAAGYFRKPGFQAGPVLVVNHDGDFHGVGQRETCSSWPRQCGSGREWRLEVVECLHIVNEPKELGFVQNGSWPVDFLIRDYGEGCRSGVVGIWDWVCGYQSGGDADETVLGVVVDGFLYSSALGVCRALDVFNHGLDIGGTLLS